MATGIPVLAYRLGSNPPFAGFEDPLADPLTDYFYDFSFYLFDIISK